MDMAKKGISGALALSNQYGLSDKLAASSNPKIALAGKLLGMADGSKTGKPRRRHMKRGGFVPAWQSDAAKNTAKQANLIARWSPKPV